MDVEPGSVFTPDSVAERANREVFVNINGRRTGKQFRMRQFTYGVLDPDPTSPLSCVSVANSSLSVDLWKGCAWRCSYCHVQGGLQDLDNTLTMPARPEPRSSFGADAVIDSLMEHPFFEADKSVISIGTASTEPFARGKVSESTFGIMERFVADGLRNPFWIVTKAGFPRGYGERLRRVTENGNRVMISICWAGNPIEVEPVRTNRFRDVQSAHESGATISWYLRPLAEGWSVETDQLERAFREASRYREWIDMIIPGGLRWTEGIEYGVEEVRGQQLPDIPRQDNVKDLSDASWRTIHTLAEKYFGDTPVYHKSSCGLSNMLEAPNHNLVQLRDVTACRSSTCPATQRAICGSYRAPSTQELQVRLANIGLEEVTVTRIDPHTGAVSTVPSVSEMTFALRPAFRS